MKKTIIFTILGLSLFMGSCSDNFKDPEPISNPTSVHYKTDTICDHYEFNLSYKDNSGKSHTISGFIITFCDEYGNITHMGFFGNVDGKEVEVYFYSPEDPKNPNPGKFSLVIDDYCVLAITEKDLSNYKKV
ncbi:MAG: hypothetical protein M0O93_06870 [Bacteroidales bacterium]|nr:hypothetical protein [Bacteroidales bacterium]